LVTAGRASGQKSSYLGMQI